jgi:hypothetical protein
MWYLAFDTVNLTCDIGIRVPYTYLYMYVLHLPPLYSDTNFHIYICHTIFQNHCTNSKVVELHLRKKSVIVFSSAS